MKYRRKPIIIDAFQWFGDARQIEDPKWINDAISQGIVCIANVGTSDVHLTIQTLEGCMLALPGSYIIKDISDEIYPCKPDIFNALYDVVT